MGNLSTPKSVQKLQKALHAKAKAESGYRFYAMYDKISREDILVHAYAQCRSNKGAPGVDGQEFAGIEAYGVQRWLGELALALRQETYRPAPIRRVFIPKANGKLRPLGIATYPSNCTLGQPTFVLRGCLTEKIAGKNRRTLSHEENCLLEMGVFAKRVAIWIFGSGRVKGSPIPGLRRQRRSGRSAQGRQGGSSP